MGTYSNIFWDSFRTSKISTKSGPLDPLFITKTLQQIQEKTNHFEKHYFYYFYTSQIYGSPFVWKCWKRQAPENDEDQSKKSKKILKILDMWPISTRKHEWDLNSMVPISARKHEMEFGNLGFYVILDQNILMVNVWKFGKPKGTPTLKNYFLGSTTIGFS